MLNTSTLRPTIGNSMKYRVPLRPYLISGRLYPGDDSVSFSIPFSILSMQAVRCLSLKPAHSFRELLRKTGANIYPSILRLKLSFSFYVEAIKTAAEARPIKILAVFEFLLLRFYAKPCTYCEARRALLNFYITYGLK